MKKTKSALLHSVIALLLCISMFISSTFAWFTDTVSSGKNVITAGNLDLEMYWTDDLSSGQWYNVEENGHNTIFSYENWEPGYTDVKYIKLVNAGDLALNYELTLTPQNGVGKLAEVINVYFAEGGVAVQQRSDLQNLKAIGLLSNVLNGGATAGGTLLAADQLSPLHPSGEVVMTVAMNMLTTAGNDYQNEDAGEFTVTALATQAPYEADSFGNDYDASAELPGILTGGSATGAVTPVDGKVPAGGVSLTGGSISAYVPEGVVLEDGVNELTLTVTPMENTTSDITVVNNEILIPVDVHIQGVAATNNVPMVIDLGEVLPKYLNMGNYRLFHVESGTNQEMTLVSDRANLTAHNQFTYDPLTGAVSVAMATFSEVAMLADTDNGWNGNFDDSWYNVDATELTIANADQFVAFGAIVGGMKFTVNKTEKQHGADSFKGKTIKLISDINLADNYDANNPNVILYPVGYYNSEGSYEKKAGANVTSGVNDFSGTFDGNGHTISHFYQNTWEMFGDYNNGYSGTPNYYKDAMGLFGYVVNGTVKNLTVDNFSSDGEFTPTGVIAAYAVNSTFENIAITNCNPRVYNTGNGGIVGIGGNSDDPDTYKLTFNNITIDNSNKITALWGSWDVACGGLVGMFRGAGYVYMTNCHVAAQIDVYNDVCGNYQYYWYRYSGMMVGTNKNMITDDDGYTVPETEKFHAENCTVHFGDWNDYYYCELVANSLASYTHDHQFSRLEVIDSLDEIKSGDTWTKAGNFLLFGENGKQKVSGEGTCYHIMKDANGNLYEHKHDVADATNENVNETVNGETVLKENNQRIYLPFNQLFTGYGWGVKHIPVYNGENYAFEGITILDREVADSVEKFETKFTGNFLYRVGNLNTVSVGSLFAAKSGATINDSGVWVTVEKIDEDMNVGGTFSANTTDWTKGTIQFTGTGVVKVTIQDYNYCTPTTVELEVVDAVNATVATNATANNVVLLQNCGFSSLVVSGGYTLYGNGFTMTCGSDSAALDMGYAFVTLDNGTLDNVQMIMPNFDHAVLYKSNMTESGNRSETTDKTRYFNVKSGVMASGNSQILNSRISGARAAVNISGGNCLIDNSRIELGAVASILVGAANSVILRDVTLVQKPTASTYDSSKTLMGFSVLMICNSDGAAASVTLEGTLVQNAWIDESDKQYVPSAGQSIVTNALSKTDYLHDIDGDGTNESLNLGFAYMPESTASEVETTSIIDNRTNKDTVPYDHVEVGLSGSKTYVYSYKNTNGTDDSVKTESEYKPNTQSDIITVNYADTADGLATSKFYGTKGWIYELNVDMDKLSGYALDFSKLSMTVNGVAVTDYLVDGSAKPDSPVTVNAGGKEYTLTATVNGTEYTAIYKVTGTETTKESPSLVASNYEAALLVGEAGSTLTKDTWHGAAPALNGIQVKYWSVAEKQYKTITLSDYTPTTAGQQNGTNTTWTYSPANGDFTLTLTGGQVHSSNTVDAMPVVFNSKLYFVAAGSNGLVNYGNDARTIPVTYSFKDNNGGNELTFSHTWSIKCADGDTAYDYSDFVKGTSKTFTIKSSNGNGCVTPDTLVTLADGSKKMIRDVTYEDQLLVWDFVTGSYVVRNASAIINHGEDDYNVVTLRFADGTNVEIIDQHGFFDVDQNKFVFISEANVFDYIGHSFAKSSADGFASVKLVGYSVENKLTTAYSILSYNCENALVEDMLSLTPMPGVDSEAFFGCMVVGENMTYDQAAIQEYVNKHGLYTFEELAKYGVTYDQYIGANLAYLKIMVGEGIITLENALQTLAGYVPQ